MKRYLKLLKEGIYPIFGVSEGDFENDLSKKLFFFVVIALSAVFSFFLIHSIALQLYKASLSHLITVSTTLISWQVFKRTKSLTLSGSLILTSSFFNSYFATAWMGGMYAPTFYTFVLVPIFSAAIMPLLFSLTWTVIFVLLMLYFHYSSVLGISYTSELDQDTLSNVRIFTMVCLQFILLVFVNYLRSVNKKYRDLIDQQKNQKTNLVRVVSHDISTPVTVLKTSLRRIKNKYNDDSTDFQRMEHAIKVISNILEHVREFEAISSGKKDMVLQKVNILEIFEELKQLHQHSIDSKNLEFKIEYRNQGGNFIVLADRRGLSYQVLNNLISNAIKFTDSGGTIVVLLESTPEKTTCTIKDTGVGMPKEIVDHLFSATAKTTRIGTNGEKGTGFGMPIVKNYIEKFHGKIEVQSALKEANDEDHGTTVTITLPNAS